MKDSKPAFRSAVSGYNKSDVNDYIASLAADYAKERKSLEAQLRELEAKLAEVDAAELNSKLEKAEALIASQTEQLTKSEEALAAVRLELAESNARLAAYAESEEKLKGYDVMSSKLGDLILEAAASAEKIKTAAENSATLTIQAAEARENELMEAHKTRAAELDLRFTLASEAVDRRLAEYAGEGFKSLVAAMNESAYELNALLEKRRLALSEAVSRTAEKPIELAALIGEDK